MQSLELLIKPAASACNLACSYCFYHRARGMGHGSQRMSLELAEELVRQALGLGCPRTVFCFQGGEPTLMGRSFYEEVVRLQRRYAGPGQQVENILQTNGLLLDDAWCELLKDAGFLVGISLDGPQAVHDLNRRSPGGEGSYARVLAAVRRLRQRDVPFNVLALLTTANVHDPDGFHAFVRKQRFKYVQLVPCYEWDEAAGAPTPESVDGESFGRFYCRLFDLWLKDGFPHLSIRLFEDLLLYLIDGAKVSCTWQQDCLSYVVVEHDGACYPCDFFVSASWRLGDLKADGLRRVLASRVRKEFSDRKSQLPDVCLGCEAVGFCHGGCPRLRRGPAGGYDGPDATCAGLLALWNHAKPRLPHLRKEVERIRKVRLAAQRR